MAYSLKYKVGDKVQILDGRSIEIDDDDKFNEWYGDRDEYFGKTATIKQEDEDDASYKLDIDDEEDWWAEDWLVPVTNLQVGDLVKVKPTDQLSNGNDIPMTDKTGKVMEIGTKIYSTRGGRTIRVEIPGTIGWDHGYPIGENDVELVEESKQEQKMAEMTPAKFAVGDEITVHTDTTRGNDAHRRKGWTGFVTEVRSHYYGGNEVYGRSYSVNIVNPEDPNETNQYWNIGENNLKKGTSMSSTQNLVNAKLSADERYARQNGLKGSDGTITSAGREVLMQYLWDSNEKAVVKALKDADKALRAAKAADEAELKVSPE